MAERMSTPELAKAIRDQHTRLGVKPPSYDESMARAAKVARVSEQKGNR